MAQSTDKVLRGSPSFWLNQIIEPPTIWTQWSEQTHAAIDEKEKLVSYKLSGPNVTRTQLPILEQRTSTKLDADSVSCKTNAKKL